MKDLCELLPINKTNSYYDIAGRAVQYKSTGFNENLYLIK